MFFLKRKTAYEMRISDWSSDVCSSDLELAQRELPSEQCTQGAGRWNATASDGTGHQAQIDLSFAAAHFASIGNAAGDHLKARSEEGRVGKECVRPYRSRWSA